MNRINEILDKLKDNEHAVIARGATDDFLEQCQHDMDVMDFPYLPVEYTDFLKTTDGFAYDAAEFFGTHRVIVSEVYTLTDVISANIDFEEVNGDFMDTSDYVLLGRGNEEMYVYNTADNIYEVLDGVGRDVMEEFGTFDELFAEAVRV
jgi:hypothetical protein